VDLIGFKRWIEEGPQHWPRSKKNVKEIRAISGNNQNMKRRMRSK